MYSLIETAKLNGVDPQAWLADVLARLPDHPARRLDDLLPWSCGRAQPASPPEPTPSPSTRGLRRMHTDDLLRRHEVEHRGRAVDLLIGLGLAVRILQIRGVGIEGAQLIDAQLQDGPAIGVSARDITALQKLVKNAFSKGARITTVDRNDRPWRPRLTVLVERGSQETG
jgi:hypothetical protein